MRIESYGSVKVFWPPYSRDELIEKLRTGIPALAQALPLKRAVLFGSWAKGRATVRSDVDVLVVYKGAPREDAYQIVRRCLDVRGLEPHVYTEDQAAAVCSTLDRMTEVRVPLYPLD